MLPKAHNGGEDGNASERTYIIKNVKNNKLSFSSDLRTSVKNSDIIFICVGTPTKKSGSSADLSQVFSVAKELSSSINKFKIIITKLFV